MTEPPLTEPEPDTATVEQLKVMSKEKFKEYAEGSTDGSLNVKYVKKWGKSTYIKNKDQKKAVAELVELFVIAPKSTTRSKENSTMVGLIAKLFGKKGSTAVLRIHSEFYGSEEDEEEDEEPAAPRSDASSQQGSRSDTDKEHGSSSSRAGSQASANRTSSHASRKRSRSTTEHGSSSARTDSPAAANGTHPSQDAASRKRSRSVAPSRAEIGDDAEDDDVAIEDGGGDDVFGGDAEDDDVAIEDLLSGAAAAARGVQPTAGDTEHSGTALQEVSTRSTSESNNDDGDGDDVSADDAVGGMPSKDDQAATTGNANQDAGSQKRSDTNEEKGSSSASAGANLWAPVGDYADGLNMVLPVRVEKGKTKMYRVSDSVSELTQFFEEAQEEAPDRFKTSLLNKVLVLPEGEHWQRIADNGIPALLDYFCYPEKPLTARRLVPLHRLFKILSQKQSKTVFEKLAQVKGAGAGEDAVQCCAEALSCGLDLKHNMVTFFTRQILKNIDELDHHSWLVTDPSSEKVWHAVLEMNANQEQPENDWLCYLLSEFFEANSLTAPQFFALTAMLPPPSESAAEALCFVGLEAQFVEDRDDGKVSKLQKRCIQALEDFSGSVSKERLQGVVKKLSPTTAFQIGAAWRQPEKPFDSRELRTECEVNDGQVAQVWDERRHDIRDMSKYCVAVCASVLL